MSPSRDRAIVRHKMSNRARRRKKKHSVQKDDPYNTLEKQAQRFYFVAHCVHARQKHGGSDGILYLETQYGNLTRLLLAHFPASELHPCNWDVDVVADLKLQFSGVEVEYGNIIDVAKHHARWLGVWYDMESSWCKRHTGWDWAVMPSRFDNAMVCAVTLTNSHTEYSAEQHAIDLSELLTNRGGTLMQQPFAYVGRSGVQNMVFALATFPPKPVVPIGTRVAVRWMDGKYTGRVVDVDDDHAHVAYDDGVTIKESLHTIVVLDGEAEDESNAPIAAARATSHDPDVVHVPLAYFANFKWRKGWEKAYFIDDRRRLQAVVHRVVKRRCHLLFRMKMGGFSTRVDVWKPTYSQLMAACRT